MLRTGLQSMHSSLPPTGPQQPPQGVQEPCACGHGSTAGSYAPSTLRRAKSCAWHSPPTPGPPCPPHASPVPGILPQCQGGHLTTQRRYQGQLGSRELNQSLLAPGHCGMGRDIVCLACANHSCVCVQSTGNIRGIDRGGPFLAAYDLTAYLLYLSYVMVPVACHGTCCSAWCTGCIMCTVWHCAAPAAVTLRMLGATVGRGRGWCRKQPVPWFCPGRAHQDHLWLCYLAVG